jgi:hypothetical protein
MVSEPSAQRQLRLRVARHSPYDSKFQQCEGACTGDGDAGRLQPILSRASFVECGAASSGSDQNRTAHEPIRDRTTGAPVDVRPGNASMLKIMDQTRLEFHYHFADRAAFNQRVRCSDVRRRESLLVE